MEITEKRTAIIRNIVEVPWQQFPGHFGGALSKALVCPENARSRLIDYRISCYQPMAYVAPHTHKIQEQVKVNRVSVTFPFACVMLQASRSAEKKLH